MVCLHQPLISTNYFDNAPHPQTSLQDQNLDRIPGTDSLVKDLEMSVLDGEEGVAKIAQRIKDQKPDEPTLERIERTLDSDFLFFPRLEKIILEALISIYESIGNTLKVDSLKKRIERLDSSLRTPIALRDFELLSYPLGLFDPRIPPGLDHIFPNPVPLLTESATKLQKTFPRIFKTQNVLGVGAGLGASLLGFEPASAALIGAGTNFIARNPQVKKTAASILGCGISAIKQTGATIKTWAAEQGMKCALQAGSAINTGLCWAAEHGIDYTLRAGLAIDRGVSWTAEHGMKYALQAGNSIAWAAKQGAACLDRIDSALDTLAGN